MSDPVPHVSTTHLRYLVEITSARTWGEAAQRLGVTQSALSQGIAELERRLGWPLFERVGRKRVLAADADVVVSWAQSVLAETKDVVEVLTRRRSGTGGRLRIGLIDTAILHTFATAVELAQAQLGPALRVEVGTSTELAQRVLAGDIDAAITVGGSPAVLAAPGEISERPLANEPMIVWASVDDPAMAPHSWVLPPFGSTTRDIIDHALRTLPEPPGHDGTTPQQRWADAQVVMESHNPAVLAHMAAAGFGWTVLPEGAAPTHGRLRRVLHAPLAMRPLVFLRRSAALPNALVDSFERSCQDILAA